MLTAHSTCWRPQCSGCAALKSQVAAWESWDPEGYRGREGTSFCETVRAGFPKPKRPSSPWSAWVGAPGPGEAGVEVQRFPAKRHKKFPKTRTGLGARINSVLRDIMRHVKRMFKVMAVYFRDGVTNEHNFACNDMLHV